VGRSLQAFASRQTPQEPAYREPHGQRPSPTKSVSAPDQKSGGFESWTDVLSERSAIMDIMLPKLNQQVSPPPHLVTRRAIKLPQLIRRLLSMWLSRERRLRATAPRPAAAKGESVAVARSGRSHAHGLARSRAKNRPAKELSEAI
jgi:hypothetical protein